MDTQQNPWASRLAKLCIVATLFLILIGAIVTTAGAGMAAPNAPHVDGALLNPTSPVTGGAWYKDPALFKEHTHRLAAMTVGISIGFLTAMLWRNFLAFGIAVAFMGLAEAGRGLGLENSTIAQLRVWPAMVIFITLLIIGMNRRGESSGTNAKLALVAYIATCIQAALGSLRVEIETGGNIALATNVRIFHGIFAQAFLVLLVILAARLSPVWRELDRSTPQADNLRRMGIALLGLYFFQLACAAYIRHHGIGMLIPTWPAAGAAGGLLPDAWSHAVGIHFLHTRILPILIVGHVIGLAISTARRASGFVRLTRLGWALVALVGVQVLLGVMVIWKVRQAHITNTHVVVGALFCATTALYIARAGRLREAHT